MITAQTLERRDTACALNILLAEDNDVNQKLATRLLEKRGHQVTVAGNGLQALNALSEASYDLVLMDVQMPEMDGIEATSALRAREHGTGNRQPVIAMTALVMQGDRERCLAAGMDGYLTKPIRPRALDEVLDQYISLKRKARAPHELAGSSHEQSAKPAGQTSSTPDQILGTAKSESPAVKQDSIAGHELLERVGGDREFLAELVALFREDGPKQLNKIKTALENHDSQEATRSAHALRGTLANLAAQSASDLAAEIEHASKSEDLTRANAAFHNLDLELPRVLEALSLICEGVAR